MIKRLFLIVFLCAVLSFSFALAEEGIILGCGPAKIQLPPGYSIVEDYAQDQSRLYISDDSKTRIKCVNLAADFSDDSFPLYENDAGLMKIMLHFKSGYEEDGFSVSLSTAGESAALIVKNNDVISEILFHQYGIVGICASGEQMEHILNDISVEIEDYRKSE